MNHILALQLLGHAHVVPAPGVFRVLGFKVPTLLGQVLHWAARLFRILMAIAILLLLKLKGKVEYWKMLVIGLIAMVDIPSFSPKISQYTTDVTHGTAVGSTGASAGMVVFLVVLGLVVFYRMVIKPPVVMEEEIENK
jgi:hypothetical protein